MCTGTKRARSRIDMFVFWLIVAWKKIWGSPTPFWALGMAHGREAVTVELHRDGSTERLHRSSSGGTESFKAGLFKDGDHFAFLPNDFPYHLERNVKHFVLWINPAITLRTRNADFVIDNHLIAMGYRNPCRRVFYKNSKSIKSIKDIDHIHVFVEGYPRVAANSTSNSGHETQMSSPE